VCSRSAAELYDAVNFARAGANYTAIELSPARLALAEKRFTIFGLNGNFYNCDGEQPRRIFARKASTSSTLLA